MEDVSAITPLYKYNDQTNLPFIHIITFKIADSDDLMSYKTIEIYTFLQNKIQIGVDAYSFIYTRWTKVFVTK